jgi:xylulokinase
MPLYAGFDCSTQSLSAVVIDTDRREVCFRHSLPFPSPFLPSHDPRVVHASPTMWRQTLEQMLDAMARAVPRDALRAMSGSAQQHGSVYCGDSPDTLTRETSPIWMDSSTERECHEIEQALGGPGALAMLTGSRAFPRFTGPQIRKFAREEPAAYENTRRIHLVSSYLASVLAGRHVAIDHADGSGMNLMDIRRRRWSSAALDATALDLARRLPDLIPSSAAVGVLDKEWQSRLGLQAVRLIAWSGDNPCSLVGTGLISEGQLAISLGTSDTVFGPMTEPRVSENGVGHVFASPLGEYMAITVFRNGSLARQRVRDDFGLTWSDFSAALRQTPVGNDGAMMLPWFEPEITPRVPLAGAQRFGLNTATPAQHVRAIVEAQVLAMLRHSAWMGVTPRRIYATGGAGANREILQVIADVFNADVFQFESTDSAAMGAALRAWQGDSNLPWPDVVRDFATPVPGSKVTPIAAHVEVYRQLAPAFAAREAAALAALD